MAHAALLAMLLAVTPLAKQIPKPSPTPNQCATLMIMAGVQGQKVTPENVGKLYGAALSLHVQLHKGTPLQDMFTRADLNAAAADLAACFQLKTR